MVPHEASHLILYQAARNPYNSPPSWPRRVGGLQSGDARQPLRRTAARRGPRRTTHPHSRVNSSFPLDPDQALLSYAESASVVAFISEHFGDAKLGALLTSFKQEMAYDEATQSALGVSLTELDTQWKASLGYPGDQSAAPSSVGRQTRGTRRTGSSACCWAWRPAPRCWCSWSWRWCSTAASVAPKARRRPPNWRKFATFNLDTTCINCYHPRWLALPAREC